MRILIAEDDQVLADGLLRTLRSSGAAVDHVASGSEADAALMTNTEFDLLILDLGLPKMHGLEVLKRLRARGSALPVLILTAADGVEERVKGLDYGADDYMAKPFSLQELEARVRALSRRGMGAASSTIKHGPLVYDQSGRVATLDGKMVELSARELNTTTTTVNGNTTTTTTNNAISDQLAQAAVNSILGAGGGFGGFATSIGRNGLFGTIINAVQSDTKSNILSTPPPCWPCKRDDSV